MIAVKGDEKVDLENTQLYQEASRSSLTKLKQFCKVHVVRHNLLLVIKVHLTSYICTFSTQPRVLRDQISQEILLGIVIFLCPSKIYLSSFT